MQKIYMEVFIMAFVLERLTEDDVSFFNALGIRDWTGKHQKIVIPERSTWCIDREKNIFYMRLGGGCEYEPYISVFWCNGFEIRIEEENTTLDAPKKIYKALNLPKKCSNKNEIMQLILEALEAWRNFNHVATNKTVKYIIEDDTIIEYRCADRRI
jgi:hypothetical protein